MFFLGNVLDGECFSYYSYLNDHDEYRYNYVHHRSSISATTPQQCVNHCKSFALENYANASIQSSSCWCGNVPPYIESSNCTTTCSGDSSKTCGGSGYSATFYTVHNQSKCSYLILLVFHYIIFFGYLTPV